jgi:hypothetical protein
MKSLYIQKLEFLKNNYFDNNITLFSRTFKITPRTYHNWLEENVEKPSKKFSDVVKLLKDRYKTEFKETEDIYKLFERGLKPSDFDDTISFESFKAKISTDVKKITNINENILNQTYFMFCEKWTEENKLEFKITEFNNKYKISIESEYYCNNSTINIIYTSKTKIIASFQGYLDDNINIIDINISDARLIHGTIEADNNSYQCICTYGEFDDSIIKDLLRKCITINKKLPFNNSYSNFLNDKLHSLIENNNEYSYKDFKIKDSILLIKHYFLKYDKGYYCNREIYIDLQFFQTEDKELVTDIVKNIQDKISLYKSNKPIYILIYTNKIANIRDYCNKYKEYIEDILTLYNLNVNLYFTNESITDTNQNQIMLLIESDSQYYSNYIGNTCTIKSNKVIINRIEKNSNSMIKINRENYKKIIDYTIKNDDTIEKFIDTINSSSE